MSLVSESRGLMRPYWARTAFGLRTILAPYLEGETYKLSRRDKITIDEGFKLIEMLIIGNKSVLERILYHFHQIHGSESSPSIIADQAEDIFYSVSISLPKKEKDLKKYFNQYKSILNTILKQKKIHSTKKHYAQQFYDFLGGIGNRVLT